MKQVINWASYCFICILLCITYFFSWLKGFYKRHYNLSTIGILVTLGYFSFLYQTLGFEPITWMKGAENFNEVGDFLAGVFGPVAFFWLIIGYQMQHSELRLNRKSLEKQADELEYSRKALELQVNEFKKSIKLTEESNFFNKNMQIKKDREEFISNQPRLHPYIIEAVSENNTNSRSIINSVDEIEYIKIILDNTGKEASHVVFRSQALDRNFAVNEVIKTGKNAFLIPYRKSENLIRKFNINDHETKQVLDEIDIEYIDQRGLRQTIYYTISVKFSHNNKIKLFHEVIDNNDMVDFNDY